VVVQVAALGHGAQERAQRRGIVDDGGKAIGGVLLGERGARDRRVAVGRRGVGARGGVGAGVGAGVGGGGRVGIFGRRGRRARDGGGEEGEKAQTNDKRHDPGNLHARAGGV
jgi:hypothetical protein